MAVQSPPEACWVHPAAEVRPSPIAGHGLFASSPISEGAVVVRFGGQLLTRSEFRELLDTTPSDHLRVSNEDPSLRYLDAISPYEGYVLVIPFGDREHLGRNIHFNNHSCDPNIWHTDAYTLVARRDIGADEEITVDYATQVAGEGMRIECHCGSELCREVLTNSDWRLPKLRARYGTHWIPTLLERIQRERI